jgi:hypothetical protein
MTQVATTSPDSAPELRHIPVSQAAPLFSRTAGTLKRWIKDEGCPHTRGPGGEYRVCVREVRAWLEERKERKEQAVVPPRDPDPSTDDPVTEAVDLDAQPSGRRRGRRSTRARRAPRRAQANLAREELRLALDSEFEDLRRAVDCDDLWSRAKSLSVRRVITEEGEAELLGGNDAEAYFGITSRELKRAIQEGGVAVFLQRERGSGTYEVTPVGAGGFNYPSTTIEIPSLKRAAILHKAKQADEEQKKRAARKARKQAEADARMRAVAEANAARADRERERAHNAWANDVADAAVHEWVLRLRAAEAQLLWQLQTVLRAHAKAQARLGREARVALRVTASLQRQKKRTLNSLHELRRIRRLPDLEPGALGPLEDDAELPAWPRTPRDPISASVTAPIETELAAVRARLDAAQIRRQLVGFLRENTDRLFPAPPWALLPQLEPWLPAVPLGFRPWAQLLPPAEAPGPPPWTPAAAAVPPSGGQPGWGRGARRSRGGPPRRPAAPGVVGQTRARV